MQNNLNRPYKLVLVVLNIIKSPASWHSENFRVNMKPVPTRVRCIRSNCSDFAAIYPSIFLLHSVFPSTRICKERLLNTRILCGVKRVVSMGRNPESYHHPNSRDNYFDVDVMKFIVNLKSQQNEGSANCSTLPRVKLSSKRPRCTMHRMSSWYWDERDGISKKGAYQTGP